jgi:hypothetical protein
MKCWVVCWVGEYNFFYSRVVNANTKSKAIEKGMEALGFTVSDNFQLMYAEEINIDKFLTNFFTS